MQNPLLGLMIRLWVASSHLDFEVGISAYRYWEEITGFNEHQWATAEQLHTADMHNDCITSMHPKMKAVVKINSLDVIVCVWMVAGPFLAYHKLW